jgi:carbamoyltransferase
LNILGISAYYHDSAACLLQDGRLTAAAQEERFTRKRHDPGFPTESVKYCLSTGNIQLSDIDVIAYYEKPFLKFERILESIVTSAPRSFPIAIRALPIWLKDKLWMRKNIQKLLPGNAEIIFCTHHEAHAASAFFPSPFREAATLTIDGVGEWSTTTWGVGKDDRLELKAEIRYPHSIGMLYSAVTQYLGFRVNSAEYKVMGLAPYGEPTYSKLILDNLIEVFDDGSYLLNMDYFGFEERREMITPKFDELFGRPRRNAETKLEKFHADVARSIQDVTEQVMLKLAGHVHRETGLKNLCLAGGVALNCVANGRVLREGPFEKVWIQPGAGDSGSAVGSAYVAWHHYKKQPRPQPLFDLQYGSYLGPEYGNSEIEKEIGAFNLVSEKYDDPTLLRQTATLLADQQIVGWFQGRMEFGPRALGNRSIIGDARNAEMQKRMNLKIKFRESFRPFAPSVRAEDTKEYFDIESESPYMLLTCQVWNGAVQMRAVSGDKWMSEMLQAIPSRIPAVTHVDGSARVHTVDRQRNPRFYDLLGAFKEKTGASVLINTSFNVRGEPIVCSPKDAVRCFLKTDIDALVVGNYIVRRDAQDPTVLAKWRETLSEEDRFELD